MVHGAMYAGTHTHCQANVLLLYKTSFLSIQTHARVNGVYSLCTTHWEMVATAHLSVSLYLVKMLSLILSLPGTSTRVSGLSSPGTLYWQLFSLIEFCVLMKSLPFNYTWRERVIINQLITQPKITTTLNMKTTISIILYTWRVHVCREHCWPYKMRRWY